MTTQTSRREFIGAAALVIGFAVPMGRRAAAMPKASASFAPNAFVRIAQDDSVTVIIKHVEFGQGPSTGLTTMVADELDADWSQMRMAFAPANDPLYKNLIFGTMGTGGSTAMANSWIQMRSAGAAARAMLVEAAARRWGVPIGEVTVSRGLVSHGGRTARFGELAEAAARLPVPDKPVLKTPDRWTLIGKDLPKLDSVAKSDGSAVFTVDIMRPGMVTATILHPPSFGGRVRSVDKAPALAVPGVVAVEVVPQGVVVYAEGTYPAMRGKAALTVDWDLSAAETRSSEEIIRTWAAAAASPGKEAEKTGDAAAALASATRTLEATYVFPFLAHAPMETLDAVIERRGDRADVWMGSQWQAGDMAAIAASMDLPAEAVTLHEQFAGGSFGRRATPNMDFATEAGAAAAAYPNAPVKFVWTRENDITGGRYRPIFVHKLRGGLNRDGDIIAWDQVIAGQSIFVGSPMEAVAVKNGVDATMVEGATESSYHWDNHRVGVHVMQSPVPPLWWRSVGNTHTAYTVETFVDELLQLGGKDPVSGRLARMKDSRGQGVLRRVAELADWGRPPAAGRSFGVAMHRSFGTYVAQIAEVSRRANGLPRVHKVWCAVDCGVPINPNVIRAQMEGGIGYGLGHALYGDLTLGEGGQVMQSNFHDYRSLRIGEMPDVEVAVIASEEKPTGVGEPGLPPIAPAVANAWRRLTGRSVRRLPFAHESNV
ncbi:xanthine dehydrogenase family protein molybdopterin-binding subunit [Sphingomonadaceae bacterium OTU29LAMAA1]|nr:xanthine dehydrogenase family protein molybdopterin-binding subunit [Sphingomonadaceae bacterium OTU29LAMAA1]